MPPRGLPFGRYRGDLQSLRQLGRAQIREQVRRGCGTYLPRSTALIGFCGAPEDPLLKKQEQEKEMIMGDANPLDAS